MAASVINSKNTSGTNKTTHTLSARVRKTIQTIKEIVGNFSDADIYMALKETNMDPNETTQKLLNQDPFHEVKRKRDKKKETIAYMATEDSRKISENMSQETKSHTFSNRNAQQGHYIRTAVPGNARINREFRVVRDNRVNLNTNRQPKASSKKGSASSNEQIIAIVAEKGSTRTSSNVKHPGVQSSTQASNGRIDVQYRHAGEATSKFTDRIQTLEEKQAAVPTATSHTQEIKPSSQHHSVTQASSNSVVGVYSSSMDPVHVPSLESRSSAAVGAIKRKVGVVGGRRQSCENTVKISSASSRSFSNSGLGRDDSLLDSFQPFPTNSKTDQDKEEVANESAVHSISVSRSFLGNHYNRLHQTAVGHQKASQHNKEWRPKSSQKSSVSSPGVTGSTAKSSLPPVDSSKGSESAAIELQDKLSQLNMYKNQNVIIAKHIQVPETDRYRLIFGSFGMELDSSRNIQSGGFQATGVTEDFKAESSTSFSVSAPESPSDDASGNKQVDLSDDQARNSGSDSPASAAVSEHQSPDKSLSPNLDNYVAAGLTQDNSPFIPSEMQHQLDPSELSSFSAYNPQGGYDISYFRPATDETVPGQGLPSAQEALSPHAVNNMPSSSIPMVQQQQQPPMAQMYPQIHVPQFTNLMPYRQFLSPVYVPQVAMPGYSSNPAYPHLSNGSSYLLMPGGSSHLSANGLKYGIQQFKPVHGTSPTGFGSFASPTGYPMNAPGVVGSATGLEDSSRMKYKDSNQYVPNPQAETSEIWVQNPRELSSMQSASYYNVPGQSPHTAFLPSHAGHASFNTAQSSHMQFSGLYPPPPPTPAAVANPHHLGPTMGNNGAQVGAYQQPQLGNLNWTTNF